MCLSDAKVLIVLLVQAQLEKMHPDEKRMWEAKDNLAQQKVELTAAQDNEALAHEAYLAACKRQEQAEKTEATAIDAMTEAVAELARAQEAYKQASESEHFTDLEKQAAKATLDAAELELKQKRLEMQDAIAAATEAGRAARNAKAVLNDIHESALKKGEAEIDKLKRFEDARERVKLALEAQEKAKVELEQAMVEFQAITDEEKRKTAEKDIICKRHHKAEDYKVATTKEVELKTAEVNTKNQLHESASNMYANMKERAGTANKVMTKTQKKESTSVKEMHAAKEFSMEALDDSERLRLEWVKTQITTKTQVRQVSAAEAEVEWAIKNWEYVKMIMEADRLKEEADEIERKAKVREAQSIEVRRKANQIRDDASPSKARFEELSASTGLGPEDQKFYDDMKAQQDNKRKVEEQRKLAGEKAKQEVAEAEAAAKANALADLEEAKMKMEAAAAEAAATKEREEAEAAEAALAAAEEASRIAKEKGDLAEIAKAEKAAAEAKANAERERAEVRSECLCCSTLHPFCSCDMVSLSWCATQDRRALCHV